MLLLPGGLASCHLRLLTLDLFFIASKPFLVTPVDDVLKYGSFLLWHFEYTRPHITVISAHILFSNYSITSLKACSRSN